MQQRLISSSSPSIPLFLVFVGVFWICSLHGKESLSGLSPETQKPQAKPSLQWKYGWRDGMRANTIGSPLGKDHGPDPMPATSLEAASGYSPMDLSYAYGFNKIPSGGDGTGQTIAIMIPFATSTNNLQADLNYFSSYYNLPATTLHYYTPDGTNTPYKDVNSWYAEAAMDVEWAHAMAPGATIAVIIAPDDYSLATNTLFECATGTNNKQAGAGVVSMSWAIREDKYSIDVWSNIFTNPCTTYIAAAGDNGTNDHSHGVEWPGAHTNVLSIGGTKLIYDTSRQVVVSETIWSNKMGAGGGGISEFELMAPSQATYLETEQPSLSKLANGFRCVPDLSYVADPYTGVAVWLTDPQTKIGGWTTMGGTSAGAPQVAALIARRRSLGLQEGIAFNSFIYGAYSDQCFWDIVSGSNGHQAGDGYDLASGVGTPVADAIAALTPTNSILRPQTITFGTITDRGVFGGPSFKVQATSSSGLPVNFSSSDNMVFTVSADGTLTPTGAGTASIIAQQSGDGSCWQAATQANHLLAVSKATQSMGKFPAISTKTYSPNPFNITPPSASSQLPVIVHADGPATVTTSNGVVSIQPRGIGRVVLTASQPGYNTYVLGPTNFFAATAVKTAFTIVKASQAIASFSTVGTITYAATKSFTISSPTSSSGLSVAVAVKSGPATISAGKVTLTGKGTVILKAKQSGNACYLAAPEITTTFSVQ